MFFTGRRAVHIFTLFLLCAVFLLIFASFGFLVDDEIDLEIILAGIKYYDSLINTGEGAVRYKRVQTPGLADDGHRIDVEYHLTFTERQMRMDIPEYYMGKAHFAEVTYIQKKGEGELHVPNLNVLQKRFTYYSFDTGSFTEWHPRMVITDWDEGSLYEHLKQKSFKIKEKQELNQVTCYVLENVKGEKIWIAPELGFNFLKYEHRFVLDVDFIRQGVSSGAALVERRHVSYEKYGEVWFPKHTVLESYLINKNGEEQLLTISEVETKNFRVNHAIPEEIFIVEMPNDVLIWVDDLRKHLSKKEFLGVYHLEWVK